MRINKYLNDVREFHSKFDLPVHLEYPTTDQLAFRTNFLVEEWEELRDAKNSADFIDALVDLAYIAAGTYYYLPYPCSGYVNWELPSRPELLDMLLNNSLIRQIEVHVYGTCESISNFQYTLASWNCQQLIIQLKHITAKLGFDWDRHWDAVHIANMQKEPSSPDRPSSRGDTTGIDLIKPDGWEAPDHNFIFRQYL